jgi:hypothetical protein
MVSLALFRPMKIKETVIRSRNDGGGFHIPVALTIGKRKLEWNGRDLRL